VKPLDKLNPNSKFKAVNAFIFAGSFSIGVMKAGFHLDRVLEISNTQPQENAFYFMQNFDIPVILPDEWENDEYLTSLKDVDLMCCNCPCSSLSQINRNASVDGKNNVHFYRLFNIFKKVKPKIFVIENAPTLIKLGFPILKDLVNQLSDQYNFTILRDYAGNHEVAMKRLRTMVVGWNKDNFTEIPLIHQDKQKQLTVKDVLSTIKSDVEDNFSKSCDSIKEMYQYALPNFSLMTGLAKQCLRGTNKDNIINYMKNTKHYKELVRIMDRMSNNKNYWDKTPHKLEDDKLFPSFTSVNEYIHPHKNRCLNIKESAAIMGYPEEFDFSGKSNIPVYQAMAQGVPVNFGKYIASQAKLALENKLPTVKGDIVFQHHIKHLYSIFDKEEFNNLEFLDVKKNSSKLVD